MPETTPISNPRSIGLPSSNGRSIPLFIAGTGAVGGTLVELIAAHTGNPFRIVGACDSDHYLLRPEGIKAGSVQQELAEGVPTDWPRIIAALTDPDATPGPLIFVDATGSAEVARLYPDLLEAGIHIATPSKLANTFEQAYYDRLQSLSSSKGAEFRFEPTVGAGLPVISTIRGLLETGDEVDSIAAVASGTMTYLFNELEKGVPFSRATRQARELGYAEPDPRDDLSGEDVARKFLTLARTIGLTVERSDLNVESLVPEALVSVDRDRFLDELSQVDGKWEDRIERAKERGETLRYVAKLTNHDISVGIQSVPTDSPLGQLRGTDNLFQIHTKRYSNSPIVIQGPGAGKEVTAAGVLADILNIAKNITVS